jgi:hypothetical protein
MQIKIPKIVVENIALDLDSVHSTFFKKVYLSGYKYQLVTWSNPMKPGPVRIWVRIDSPNPLVSRKSGQNGAVLQMRPEKPRSRVTAGVAR